MQGSRSSNYAPHSVGKDLRWRWATFAGVVFSPAVSILIVATVVLIYFSLNTPKGTVSSGIEAVITVIISIFSGLAGAFISKRWSEINEGSILVTRGKSAIRGLKLLLLNTSAIEQRIKVFLNHLSSARTQSGDQHDIIKVSYEELVERCNSLQEEAINAIEEWQDIIPEANIKTQIGILTDLKVQQLSLEQQISKSQDELAETRAQSEDDRERLTNQLKKKEGELREVKSKFQQKKHELDPSILGSVSATSILASHTSLTNSPENISSLLAANILDKSCRNCGASLSSSLSTGQKCPICGKEQPPRIAQ